MNVFKEIKVDNYIPYMVAYSVPTYIWYVEGFNKYKETGNEFIRFTHFGKIDVRDIHKTIKRWFNACIGASNPINGPAHDAWRYLNKAKSS